MPAAPLAADASTNEIEFVRAAAAQGFRANGRGLNDIRPVRFEFSARGDTATVSLGGETRAMATITATLDAPYPDRPNEGSLRFHADIAPAASAAAAHSAATGSDAAATAAAADALARTLDVVLGPAGGGGVVDLESLVVVPGAAAWAVRVDVTLLAAGGSERAACLLAAVAVLAAWRRPAAEATDGRTVGDPAAPAARVLPAAPAVPLSLHRLPLGVCVGLVAPPAATAVGGVRGREAPALVADPDSAEEAAAAFGGGWCGGCGGGGGGGGGNAAAAAAAAALVVATPAGDVLHVASGGGPPCPLWAVGALARLGTAKAAEVGCALRAALSAHAAATAAAAVRRRVDGGGAAAAPSPSGRSPCLTSFAPVSAVAKVEASGGAGGGAVVLLAADSGRRGAGAAAAMEGVAGARPAPPPPPQPTAPAPEPDKEVAPRPPPPPSAPAAAKSWRADALRKRLAARADAAGGRGGDGSGGGDPSLDAIAALIGGAAAGGDPPSLDAAVRKPPKKGRKRGGAGG